MQAVSSAYKEQIQNEWRNHSYVRVSYGVFNLIAGQQARLADNGRTVYGNLNINDDILPDRDYATFEKDYWRVDGKQLLLPAVAPYNYDGFVSSAVSGGDNTFVTDPTITVSFSDPQDIFGLTFTFPAGQVPQEIKVNETAYYPDSKNYVMPNKLTAVTQITIDFVKAPAAGRRIRLNRLQFGQTVHFENEQLIKTSFSSSIDFLSLSLTQKQLSVTIDNSQQVYNPLNPSGLYAYLAAKQPVEIDYGYELDDGSIEWMVGDNLVLESTPTTADTQAIFTAVDNLFNLTGMFNKGLYRPAGISLYDLAKEVLDDAGVEHYVIDDHLKNIYTKAALPMATHRECLQIIANAGQCILYTDRAGAIKLEIALDPTIQVGDNGHMVFSSAESAYNDESLPTAKYVDFLPNSWRAAGAKVLLPAAGPYIRIGFVSDVICAPDGSYADTESGNCLEFKHSIDEKMSSLAVHGKTSQAVTAQGKNLFDKSKITNSGQYVDFATGNYTANPPYCVSAYIPVAPNTTYYASHMNLNHCQYDASFNFIKPTDGYGDGVDDGYYFTTYSNAHYIRISVPKANLDIAQFERGNCQTSYAPFTPDSPSPDYPAPISGVLSDISICGKNLIAGSGNPVSIGNEWAQSGWIGNGLATRNENYVLTGINGWQNARYKLPDQYKGKTVTLQCDMKCDESTTDTASYLSIYNENSSIGYGFISIVYRQEIDGHNWKHVTYTGILNDSGYIGFISETSAEGTGLRSVYCIKNLQVELGSVETDFEPYQGQTVSLPQTLYSLPDGTADSYDAVSGRGVQSVGKLVLTGQENIVIDSPWSGSSGTTFMIDGVSNYKFNFSKSLMYCSHFKSAARSEYTDAIQTVIILAGGGAELEFVHLKSWSTVADFKAWLAAQYAAGTPVTVLYELATPTVINGAARQINTYFPVTHVVSNEAVTASAPMKYPVFYWTYSFPYSAFQIPITFDNVDGEYATDFDVVYKLAGREIDRVSVTGNTTVTYTVEHEVSGMDEIDVEIHKWSVGTRRAMIAQIGKGRVNDMRIDFNTASAKPVVEKSAQVKTVTVNCYSYTPAAAATELYHQDITPSGTVTLNITHDAATEISASVTGIKDNSGNVAATDAVITAQEHYTYYSVVTLTGTKPATLSISGKVLTTASVGVVKQLNPQGEDKAALENPLITDLTNAQNTAVWIADYFSKRNILTTGYRGNTEIDAHDLVYMESEFEGLFPARIMEHKIEFNGALSGNVKAVKMNG